jgi:uncharacterized iron-regulated protein
MLIRIASLLCCIAFAGTAASGEPSAPAATPAAGDGGTAMSSEKEQDREKKKPPKPVGESPAVDLSALETLDRVIGRVAEKRIVYVGEYHDRSSNHAVQLEVIKALHSRDPKLGVGMEMFQRPFQGALDEYIAGTIDERAFLKRSEYFKRWGFDYQLYKPLLDFCREQKVPVVALNVRREITQKVSQSGLESLTAEEKKDVPAQMDLTDEEYRSRLKKVFEEHKSADDKNFEFFLQAQVLWDETMAESVAAYLGLHPDHRMVVIAGGGHLAYGAGIPKRAHRRNGLAYAIIMNDADVEPKIADYLVYPEEVDGVKTPRIMATLSDKDGKVVITDFPKNSVSREAGLRTGDVILSLDGNAVTAVDDVRIELLYKKKDEKLAVKVLRKRFLLGDTELTVEVTL